MEEIRSSKTLVTTAKLHIFTTQKTTIDNCTVART
jgi:hypothetical protein